MTTDRYDATDQAATEPDDATVEQVEHAGPLTTIPVCVEGPTTTRELPAKASGYRRVTVGTTTPLRVLGRDPRRKRAVLQVYDAMGATHGVMIGTTINEVAPPASFAARLAVSAPATAGAAVASPLLELTSLDELWLLADTAACDVTVISEQWAE